MLAETNVSDIYVITTGYLIHMIYFVSAEKQPTLYDSSSWLQQHFNWKLQTGNIDNIYVSSTCICHPFIGLSISGSNSQY